LFVVVFLFACLFVCLSVFLFVCFLVCLFACLFVRLYLQLSTDKVHNTYCLTGYLTFLLLIYLSRVILEKKNSQIYLTFFHTTLVLTFHRFPSPIVVVVIVVVVVTGLSTTVWMGRTQTIKRPNITFYLDGAHTAKSIEVCLFAIFCIVVFFLIFVLDSN